MTRIKKSLKIKSAPTNIAGAFFNISHSVHNRSDTPNCGYQSESKKDIQWRVPCSFTLMPIVKMSLICDRLFHSHFSLLVPHG